MTKEKFGKEATLFILTSKSTETYENIIEKLKCL
jgi:hypothetical protein